MSRKRHLGHKKATDASPALILTPTPQENEPLTFTVYPFTSTPEERIQRAIGRLMQG